MLDMEAVALKMKLNYDWSKALSYNHEIGDKVWLSDTSLGPEALPKVLKHLPGPAGLLQCYRLSIDHPEPL